MTKYVSVPLDIFVTQKNFINFWSKSYLLDYHFIHVFHLIIQTDFLYFEEKILSSRFQIQAEENNWLI